METKMKEETKYRVAYEREERTWSYLLHLELLTSGTRAQAQTWWRKRRSGTVLGSFFGVV